MFRQFFSVVCVFCALLFWYFWPGNEQGVSILEAAHGTQVFSSLSHHEVAARQTEVAPPQTKCPVMGGSIDPEMYVDVQGKRIYICCMACEDAIKAEPEKYIKKIEGRGEAVQIIH